MDEMKRLQERIRILEDLEAIRKLKARYSHCNDRKLWSELGDCFTKDAVLELPIMGVKIQGRDAIIGMLRERESPVTVVHQAHDPELEVLSETEAKGLWGEYHLLVDKRPDSSSEGWGFYEEEYVKEDGRWKIRYERLIFTATLPIDASQCKVAG